MTYTNPVGIGNTPRKVRPASSERASTLRPMLLRSSFSEHVGVAIGRASGAAGEGSSRAGPVQWLVQKNPNSPPFALTPPEGTLNQPCLTLAGPTIVGGASTFFDGPWPIWSLSLSSRHLPS